MQRRRADQPRGQPADARHRPVGRGLRAACAWAAAVVTIRANISTRTPSGARWSASGSPRSPSSATPSPSRCWRPCEARRRRPGGPMTSGRLKPIFSSGVMFSAEVKQGLLDFADIDHHRRHGRHRRRRWATSIVSRATPPGETARFADATRRPRCSTRTTGEVEPGSDEIGMIANGGPAPVGYYKDPEKSAAHLPGHRRPPLQLPRRLRQGRRRRHADPARPRLGLHQHRRREGVPRRGGGGAEGPSGRRGLPGGRRRRTRASASG